MIKLDPMITEANRGEQLGQHELLLGSVIKRYEQPLLKGLWNRWGNQTLESGLKRGWLVCGPGRNALSRIINWETGIPILPDGDPYTREHLRLSRLYFHAPPDTEVKDMWDHEFLSYFNGKGSVIHIDPTWQLTFGDKKHLTGDDDLSGTILTRKFSVSEYENALHEIYNLVPFDQESDEVKESFEYNKITNSSQRLKEEYYKACYTDQITSEIPFRLDPLPGENLQPYADPYERCGTHLADFIRTIIPEWTGIKFVYGQ